jgi:DNA-binding FadR family transcriptional regulator
VATLKKIKTKSLVDNIVEAIEKAIVSGQYKASEKLPSILELGKMIGASSGTIREALRVLQQKGLIEVKLGVKGGAFVKAANTRNVTDSIALLIRQREVSLKDLAEFRRVIEAGLHTLVCKTISEEQIKNLRVFLEKLQKWEKDGGKGWPQFLSVEVELRKYLIRISGNRMYEAVLTPIHENIYSYFNYALPFYRADIHRAYRDWVMTIEAFEKHDSEKAAQIVVDHIEHFTKLMINSVSEKNRKGKKQAK